MGGPSDKDLESDEFISKWVDNEFSASFERDLFARLIFKRPYNLDEKSAYVDKEALMDLSEDELKAFREARHKAHLENSKNRAEERRRGRIIRTIENQTLAKAILNDFLRVDNVKPTIAKQTEIRKLVNSYIGPYLQSDLTQGYDEDLDEDTSVEETLLISKFIDGELPETESDNLVKRISESAELKRLYEELKEDKERLGGLYHDQKVSDPVASRINEMVRKVLDE